MTGLTASQSASGTSDYDAVVIGAGHNGLAAAVHLASKGWKVAVIEKNAKAGGAVVTEQVTQPGFHHDLCAMNLSMFAGSKFFADYKKDLVDHGLALVQVQSSFASAFPNGNWIGVNTNDGLTSGGPDSIPAHDIAAWKELETRFEAEAAHIFALLGSRMPSIAAARVLYRSWRSLGTHRFLDYLQLFMSSPRDFLDRYFVDPKLKAMLAVWGLHLDFTPDTAGGALFPYLEAMGSQQFGLMIGKGGADTIVKAMVSLLRHRGGELILGAAAEKIESHQGKASAVHLADGRVFTARKAVIANLHPKIVFGGLLNGSGHAVFDKKVSRFRSAPGSLMIHLAMSGKLAWQADVKLDQFAYVHLAPDLAMMSQAYSEAAAGLLPGKPVIVVGQPTAIDPSRAPDGQHILWIQVRVVPAEIRGDAAGEIAVTDWDVAKEGFADRVIDQIAVYAPTIRESIVGRAVFSPVDLERLNSNLVGGDGLGGSHRLDQNFIFRPVAGWSGYTTPVKNLYLCGASTWPGAGTGAGSGYQLGRMLAK